jgi:uncharacterized protein
MEDNNLATVRRVYEAMQARDVDRILGELFSPDITIWQTPDLPWGGTHHRHDGAIKFFVTLVEHIQSQVTTEYLYPAGDHVVQIGRTRGTVVANGASFDISEVHLWELRDEKVVRFEVYIDTPAMLEALSS